MKFPVYAIRDKLLGFGMPILRDNDAVASRAFEYDVTRSDSPYSAHPEDYTLFYIGEYDTDSAHINSVSPRLVSSATDFIKE